jgi:hypothetical protein
VFFIIWGFRTRFKTLANGMFFCPKCGGDRSYELRSARRWFTLYYIPLFPAGKPGNEHVRCTTCSGTFARQILARPTSGQLSSLLLDGVRGAVVHVLRTGSTTSPAAREIAVAEIGRAGLSAYTDADLTADLDVVPGDLAQLFGTLGGQLADGGKESLLTSASRVALADGALSDLERQVLGSIGANLGMTPVHVAGVITTAEQSARA